MTRHYLVGEFATPEAMTEAARNLAKGGYAKDTETHSPYPVPEAYELLEPRRSPMAKIVAFGGALGVASAYLLQWWCNAVDYPINVGGRPNHALPSFIPITFELGVLFAGLSAFFGLWTLLGLPRPHHSLFELERFRSAFIDRFWVSVITSDPDKTADILTRLKSAGALHVDSIPEQRA